MEQITVNMENLSEEEREQLIKLVTKSNQLKNEVWKPKIDEQYYYIDDDSEVDSTCSIGNQYDVESWLIGNCFKTKEDAEFAIEKLKVIAELKRFAKEHNEHEIDWNNNKQYKHYIVYDCFRDCFDFYDCSFIKMGRDIYFSSKKVAEEAVETIGADRLKKYYFEAE